MERECFVAVARESGRLLRCFVIVRWKERLKDEAGRSRVRGEEISRLSDEGGVD